MFYIGFFSFTGYGDETESELDHGYACCVTEARDLLEAWAKFGQLIAGYRTNTDDLDRVASVYLRDVIEIGKLPPEGVVAQWTWQTEEAAKGVQIVGLLTYPPKTGCEHYDYPDPKCPVLRKLPPAFVEFNRDAARSFH